MLPPRTDRNDDDDDSAAYPLHFVDKWRGTNAALDAAEAAATVAAMLNEGSFIDWVESPGQSSRLDESDLQSDDSLFMGREEVVLLQVVSQISLNLTIVSK